ncbi:AlpA family transcriptional regulator [Paraburkholderia sp. BL6669N2]|uniref:helix-turn-helix transcriptional regulator n=1 Tax=Paraburkholderia sp. BL6669N2 TaxID=1938807 RepID=UPI000E2678A6|nr:AlpA family phage regulatory protein [Paraburkholderia sp. BL6669N2]REG61536.1 AlpA family transcriptional regulator [Paraburkholderia sp. BL6669N2]
MSGTTQLLRLPAVIAAAGLKKSMIYNLIRKGKFARPVVLNPRAVAWRQEDMNALVASRSVAGSAAQ